LAGSALCSYIRSPDTSNVSRQLTDER
jgi:hypothetical protein